MNEKTIMNLKKCIKHVDLILTNCRLENGKKWKLSPQGVGHVALKIPVSEINAIKLAIKETAESFHVLTDMLPALITHWRILHYG